MGDQPNKLDTPQTGSVEVDTKGTHQQPVPDTETGKTTQQRVDSQKVTVEKEHPRGATEQP